MTEAFYPKRRLKVVKEAVRTNSNLKHGGEADKELRKFLTDLAESIARQHHEDPEAAFHYVIRNMGEVARKNSKKAYHPYGFKDPFRKKKKAPPPKPKEDPPAIPRWTYPVVHQPPDGPTGPFDGIFRDYSALKMFGYTVGKTAGWPEAKRRRFLSDFMEMKLPPIVEKTFGDEYGDPMTTTRLHKMANVISANASNFWRNDAKRYQVAISEWEDDLQFLRRKYYERAGLKFHPWPDTR